MLLDPETERALERAYTPYPVIRAGLGYALDLLSADVASVLRDPERPRILDWCAGPGAWAQVARARWPQATITTVELVPSERRYLERVADHVLIGDWRLALAHGPYDLVIGNPAFSQLLAAHGRPHRAAPVLQLLRVAPIVIALHTIEILQRSEAGRWVARRRPPAIQVDLPGGIQFYPNTGQDLRSYAIYGWTRRHRGPGWLRAPLPHDLAPDERRWSERPGTEARP
jgi:hypothetical protein